MKYARPILVLFALLALAGCNDQLPPAMHYATFKGVVVDSKTQAPIPNATITVDTVLTTTSGSDGTFSLSNVPTGDVDYVIKADGYQPFYDTKHADPSATLTVTAALSH